MAHSALIDGTAYGIKGGKCLVDGTEYSIKRGIGLVDGTQVEYKFTVEPSFVINSKSDWDNFVQNASTFSKGELVRLETDIDFMGASFQSIDFSGDFDGGNHVLENATVTAVNGRCGIFRELRNGQKICNLIIINFNISVAQYTGVIFGEQDTENVESGLLQNITLYDVSVSGICAGGICGKVQDCTILYCAAEGVRIEIYNIDGLAGGIAGVSNATITQSYTSGLEFVLEFPVSQIYGGIVGENGGEISHGFSVENKISGQNLNGVQIDVIEYADFYSNYGNIGLNTNVWIIEDGYIPYIDAEAARYMW